MKYNKGKINKKGRVIKHGSGPRDRQRELQAAHDEALVSQIKEELMEQFSNVAASSHAHENQDINAAINTAVLETKTTLEEKFNKILAEKNKEIKNLKASIQKEPKNQNNVLSLKSTSLKSTKEHNNKKLEDTLSRLKLELNDTKTKLVEFRDKLCVVEDKLALKEEVLSTKDSLINDLKATIDTLKASLEAEKNNKIRLNNYVDGDEEVSESKPKKARPKMDKIFIDPSEDPLYKVETHITIDPTENERIVINEKVDKLKSLLGKLP